MTATAIDYFKNGQSTDNRSSLIFQIEQLKSEIARLRLELEGFKTNKVIVAHSNGLKKIIKLAEITMITAQSNYSTITTVSCEQFFTSKTLKYWQKQINSSQFLRVHSSYLINLDEVEEFDISTKRIFMSNGSLAKLSDAYTKIFKDAISSLNN